MKKGPNVDSFSFSLNFKREVGIGMNSLLRVSAQPPLTNPTHSEPLLSKRHTVQLLLSSMDHNYCTLYYPPPPQSSFVLSIVTCRNHKTENANCTFLASILLDPMDNQRIYTCAATHTCPSTKGLIFPPLSMTKRYITTTNPPKEVISLISGKTLRQKIRFSIGKKLILILICLVTLYTASLYQRRYLTSISFSL